MNISPNQNLQRAYVPQKKTAPAFGTTLVINPGAVEVLKETFSQNPKTQEFTKDNNLNKFMRELVAQFYKMTKDDDGNPLPGYLILDKNELDTDLKVSFAPREKDGVKWTKEEPKNKNCGQYSIDPMELLKKDEKTGKLECFNSATVSAARALADGNDRHCGANETSKKYPFNNVYNTYFVPKDGRGVGDRLFDFLFNGQDLF